MRGPCGLVRISASPRFHFRMFKIDFKGFANHERARNQALLDARGVLEGLVDGDEGTLEGLEVQLPQLGRELYVDLLVDTVPLLTGLTQMSLGHRIPIQVTSENLQFWLDSARRLAEAREGLEYVMTPLFFSRVERGGLGEVMIQWEAPYVSLEDREKVELTRLGKRTPGYVFTDS